MEKKLFLTTITVSVLLFSALAGTQLVDLGRADPYISDFVEVGEMPAPEGTEPLTILIISPENNTLYSSNNISLNFNTSWSESIDFFGYSKYTIKQAGNKTKLMLITEVVRVLLLLT